MVVSTETPDWRPNRSAYICPGCNTAIPFGTETTEPPDNCPKCRRRLYIPKVIGQKTFGRGRCEHDEQDEQGTPTTASYVPGKLRRVHIAASVFFGLLTVALCLLWVRSYWRCDIVSRLDISLALSSTLAGSHASKGGS